MILTTGIILLSLNQEIGHTNFLFNHTRCSDAQVMEIIKERPNTIKLQALQEKRDQEIKNVSSIIYNSKMNEYSTISEYSISDIYNDLNINISLPTISMF